jgi:hypothetical protein
MKALEKAAKDREGGEAVTPASPVTAGLSLEPIPENASVTPQPAPAAAASPAARSNTSAEAKPSAKAASVMQAGRDARSSPGILRTRPLFVFSVVAGLVALSYGGYVYLQLTNPALFVKQAPRPPQTAQVNPAPVAPAPTNAAQTPPPLSSLGETEVPRAAPDAATATASKDGSAVAPAIPLPALANAIATAATELQPRWISKEKVRGLRPVQPQVPLRLRRRSARSRYPYPSPPTRRATISKSPPGLAGPSSTHC